MSIRRLQREGVPLTPIVQKHNDQTNASDAELKADAKHQLNDSQIWIQRQGHSIMRRLQGIAGRYHKGFSTLIYIWCIDSVGK